MKKIFATLLMLVTLMIGLTFNSGIAYAEVDSNYVISENYTLNTAYNYSYWKYATTKTCFIPEKESEAYFKVRMEESEKIYASCTRDQLY